MSRQHLAYWVLVLVPITSLAPCQASDPVSAVLACRQIADAAQRLACYDRESVALAPPPGAPAVAAVPRASAPSAAAPVTSAAPVTASGPATAAPLTARPSATSAPAVTAAPPAQAAAPVHSVDPRQTFGLAEGQIAAKEVAAGTRPADLTKIDAHITELSAANGRAVFTLDNGQVWRQLLSEGELLAKPGDAVTISRGLLHSYWLALKSGRGCKVTRIR